MDKKSAFKLMARIAFSFFLTIYATVTWATPIYTMIGSGGGGIVSVVESTTAEELRRFGIGLSTRGGFATGPDGLLYVITETRQIRAYDPSTGAAIRTFGTGLALGSGLAFGPSGKVYVTSASGRIRAYDVSTGHETAEFGGGVSDEGADLEFDDFGNLYYLQGSSLARYNVLDDTEARGLTQGISEFGGLEFDEHGLLYLVIGGGVLGTYDPTSGMRANLHVGVSEYSGLSFGDSDELFLIIGGGTLGSYIPSSSSRNNLGIFLRVESLAVLTEFQSTVPEPTITALVALGLLSAGYVRKRRTQ